MEDDEGEGKKVIGKKMNFWGRKLLESRKYRTGASFIPFYPYGSCRLFVKERKASCPQLFFRFIN